VPAAGLVLNHGNYATAGSVTSGTDYKVKRAHHAQRCQRHAGHQRHELHADPQHGRAGRHRQHGAERQVRAGRDLDASGTTYTSALVRQPHAFNGTFAGLGHTISNLTIVAGSRLRRAVRLPAAAA
jgi:hypothetical protein